MFLDDQKDPLSITSDDKVPQPAPQSFQSKWLLALCISLPLVYLSLNLPSLLSFVFV